VPAWVLWLIVAGALGVAELTTLTLVLGLLAVAALAAGLVAAVGAPVALQLLAFAGSALGLLWVVRPVARRQLSQPSSIRTGVAALVGKQATALSQVDARGGQVKIGGEVWSARSYAPHQVIAPGTVVDVFEIEGATALVYAPEVR
jgi:membrane protein implicated in regulation of membrane protease activity